MGPESEDPDGKEQAPPQIVQRCSTPWLTCFLSPKLPSPSPPLPTLLPELPWTPTVDDLISRPLPDLVGLLPILQARQTWLQQKHTELAGAALQLENTLSPPTAGLVSPQTTGPVSFQFDDPLPPNPHEWLSRFHAYVLSHPRVQSFWSTYTSRYHCATWQSITYDLLSSFAIDARRVVSIIPHDSWRPRYHWILSSTQTLNADTVIDGGPLPPDFPKTYVTLNDALNPVSSAPSWTNSASTVPSMNAVWCVHPSTPTTAAQWFFDRLSSQLPTTTLIVVPTGHALQRDLTSHPSVSLLSEITHFTAIPQSLNMPSSPYSLPVTLFLAHIGSPLPPHQIVSMLGPICRKNSATLYPLPPQWVQPTSRQRMRDLFWSKWHAQTAHARDMSSFWTHSDWCAFLRQRATYCGLHHNPTYVVCGIFVGTASVRTLGNVAHGFMPCSLFPPNVST